MTMTRRASAAAAAAAAEASTHENAIGRRSSARKTSRAMAKSETIDTDVGVNAKTPGNVEAVEAKMETRKRSRDKEPASTATKADPASQPEKRPRGRPKKSMVTAEPVPKGEQAQTTAPVPSVTEQDGAQEPPVKRSRRSGRKSKADTAAACERTAVGVEAAQALVVAKLADVEPLNPPRTSVLAGAAAAAEKKTALAPPDSAAEVAHQLQPYDNPELAPPPAAATVPPLPLQPQPPSPPPPAPPRSPLGLRQPLGQVASPQRKPLGANNAAVSGCILPTATGATTALGAILPAAGSPKAQAPAGPKSDMALADQEIAQIRRLLMPGALAGTLVSCAAASASVPPAAAGSTAVGGSEGSTAEPAGRTGQFKELHNMVSDCCSSGRGNATYISGLPGTGKTYTVSRLLASLPGLAASSNVSFCCATLNCMAVDDPAKLYGRLQNELIRSATAESGGSVDLPDVPTPADATAAHASLISTLLKLSLVRAASGGTAKPGAGTAKSKGAKRGRGGAAAAQAAESEEPRRRVFIVVLDEVDRLLRRRDGGEELARLFQLPAAPGLSVVLLAVANSLDLTERMMPLLRARGLAPRHMVFTAYSRPQVLAILSAQLSAHPRGRRLFDDAALDMVAKSVSSSSGDLRQALKACRTALDVFVEHNRTNPAAPRASVGIREVHAALQRICSQGNGQSAMVAKIKGLPPQQQLVLLALATAVGARAAAAGADAAVTVLGGTGGGGGFQPGGALFTGSRPKFADAVAFRELGNNQAAPASNPGACFDGPLAVPTPSKTGRAGAGGAAATPTASRVRGIMGPGGGNGATGTPGSCAGSRAGPPSRTPASILAGDAGLALGLADVYAQYGVLCRQLDIPAMSESAFRTDALQGLDCDGLLRMTEGRTPAATRLSLRAMVRDVQTALADNVMFKRLMGARAPAAGAPGTVGNAVRA